jgi:hypothetical protein
MLRSITFDSLEKAVKNMETPLLLIFFYFDTSGQ